MGLHRLEKGEAVLPDKDNYVWRANRVGDDSIEVVPSDPNFCYDCEYIIGVYGSVLQLYPFR